MRYLIVAIITLGLFFAVTLPACKCAKEPAVPETHRAPKKFDPKGRLLNRKRPRLLEKDKRLLIVPGKGVPQGNRIKLPPKPVSQPSSQPSSAPVTKANTP